MIVRNMLAWCTCQFGRLTGRLVVGDRVFSFSDGCCRFALLPQVKSKFQVAWVDPADPSKGFKYIYLSPADYATLSATGSVIAHKVSVPGVVKADGTQSAEDQYVVTDIIGSGEDLGVENLRGSATIAGEVGLAMLVVALQSL